MEKAWLDIRNVIENQHDKMDWNYLLKHCKDFSDFLNKTEIYDRIKKWEMKNAYELMLINMSNSKTS